MKILPRKDNGKIDWNSATGILALFGLSILITIYLNL